MTLIPPRTHTCIDCGFLALGNREVASGDRWMLASRGTNAKMPVLTSLRCYRSLWVQYDTDYCGNPDGPKLDEVNRNRRCEGFVRYMPGFSSEELMKRLLGSKDKKTQFFYTLLAAFLAAILALLGQTGQQWVAKFLGLTKAVTR